MMPKLRVMLSTLLAAFHPYPLATSIKVGLIFWQRCSIPKMKSGLSSFPIIASAVSIVFKPLVILGAMPRLGMERFLGNLLPNQIS